jgi:hypothetical protein
MSDDIKIIKGIDSYNKIIIINLNQLKNYEFLKDARVFKLLFGICEDSKFGNFEMEKTDGYINLFRDFDITLDDWLLFISFIKNGFIPHHLDQKIAILKIERLNNICNKFGGINSFDEYYRKFYDNLSKKMEKVNLYNPQAPEEDNENKYFWTIIDSSNQFNYSNFAEAHKPIDGWSAHKTFSNGSFLYTWWRKLK